MSDGDLPPSVRDVSQPNNQRKEMPRKEVDISDVVGYRCKITVPVDVSRQDVIEAERRLMQSGFDDEASYQKQLKAHLEDVISE